MAVVIVFNWMNPQNPISPIIIAIGLVTLSFLAWLINHNLKLINKYCFLMGYLKPLVCIDNICNKSITDVVKNAYDFPPRPSPCWKMYYELGFKNVDTQYNKLNMNLNRLKNFPYWLLCPKNIDLIRHDFTGLFSDTETLYKSLDLTHFDYVIGNRIDFDKIGGLYDDFIQKLKDSQQEFEEIKKDIPKVLTFHEIVYPPSLYSSGGFGSEGF